jgi:hypothetical protein
MQRALQHECDGFKTQFQYLSSREDKLSCTPNRTNSSAAASRAPMLATA